MSPGKLNLGTPPHNLASLLRGLYRRVADHLDVDPSYVSRVARGERQSEAIEAALEREMRQIMKMMKSNHDGAGRYAANRDGSNHNGTGRHGAKKTNTAKRENTKVSKGRARIN
jgi:hypothetical protein